MKFNLRTEPLGLALIIGSFMAIVGNILHPRDAAETMPVPQLTAHLIEENHGLWLFAHGWMLAMIPIMTVGFVGLFRYLYKLERNFSIVGLVLVSAWAVLSLFVFIMDGFVGAIFGDQMSAEMFRYNYFFGLVITTVSFLLYGPGIAAFSLSAMKAKVFGPWLNWLGIGVGAFTIVGYPLGIFGAYMVYSPIFPLYAVIATVWSLMVGIKLLRLPTKS